jgi:2-polyprenyl-6-methoxyphenol hydroxylase-like FAD-dependent oxidoreductase
MLPQSEPNLSMTVSEVVQRCGARDELGGSGINIFIYHLDDGSIVGIGTTELQRRSYMWVIAQSEIQQDALNAILTFQALEQQHQVSLGRKASLLASLAFMRNGDATTIQDVTWRSEDCDLLVLADGSGRVVALHATNAEFPVVVQQRPSLSSRIGAILWRRPNEEYFVRHCDRRP